MLNKAAAELLEGFADALEIRGANTFRVRAFRNAARRVDSLTTDVAELVESGEISKVRGIGKGIAGVLG
ncbi:MAG: histidinol-phosphatase, partial [Chloroflexi bacterium]|nr:histidinol-phosphatase [Chloroflexota bacterium]